MKELYVVEYSVEQDCWNISLLEDVLKTNLRMIINKFSNDYKIVYYGDYEDCTLFIKSYEEVWNEHS